MPYTLERISDSEDQHLPHKNQLLTFAKRNWKGLSSLGLTLTAFTLPILMHWDLLPGIQSTEAANPPKTPTPRATSFKPTVKPFPNILIGLESESEDQRFISRTECEWDYRYNNLKLYFVISDLKKDFFPKGATTRFFYASTKPSLWKDVYTLNGSQYDSNHQELGTPSRNDDLIVKIYDIHTANEKTHPIATIRTENACNRAS